MRLLRPGLDPRIVRTSDLARLRHGSTVEVAGVVTARQRPETANGVTFVLLEDERGSVNLVVPPPVYERHRALVRTAPLIRARGRLERREGTINVVVSSLALLQRAEQPATPNPTISSTAPRAVVRGRCG
jgi:error-prone DNA polymerase